MTVSSDAVNKLQDLSGVVIQPGENPYNAFINACKNDPQEIQALYTAHRTKRNAQQKEMFLSPDFKELIIDMHLFKLLTKPGFSDERNCLVFWARPPEHVLRLAETVQDLLRQKAQGLWMMPTQRMHMTALEVAFSKTPGEIATLVQAIRPAIPAIVNYNHTHRPRLVKPMISYDLSAFALSFVPAAGETSLSPPPSGVDDATYVVQADEYTYHHLRRDVFDKVKEAGIEVGSRYQVPSAHITLGRYLTQDHHDTPEKRRAWIEAIDDINAWLEKEVWGQEDAELVGEWVVGQEKGLDARCGALWYGGGRTIMLGEGF